MDTSEIKLNMNMADFQFIKGTAKSILEGTDDEYATLLDIVLPANKYNFPNGRYNLTYDDARVLVVITLLENEKNDPVYEVTHDLNFGASGTGLELIPFSAFTDNRGKYPAVHLRIVIAKRIASWIDSTSENGMKMDHDYEKLKITGGPDNEEKITALIILNRLIQSQNWQDIPPLKYEDVTMFLEHYYKSRSNKALLLKINALCSKDAYKQGVYDYLLPKIDETGTKKLLQSFVAKHLSQEIVEEGDLLSVIQQAIDDVLKHQIEFRRWIEPFWDGEKTTNHKGEKITLPRAPKGETKIQPTLHVILDLALAPMGIQVIRESDEGIGSLDFRFLYTTKQGTPLSVGIEFKIAHHKELKKGIFNQLPAYLKAIRSTSGMFVVMWFKDGKHFKDPKDYEKDRMESWLAEQAIEVSKEKRMNIRAAILDASIRPSASTL